MAIAGAVLLPACSLWESVNESPHADGNVTASEITRSLADTLGRTVTIRSRALEVVGDRAFWLDDNQLIDGDRILIKNETGEAFVLPRDAAVDVQVTGIVAAYAPKRVEAEFDYRIPDTLYYGNGDIPVVLAEFLALAPTQQQILNAPEQYFDLEIALPAEVGQVFSARAFTVENDGLFSDDALLAIAPTDLGLKVVVGNSVVLTGSVRPFVLADIEREYDTNWADGRTRSRLAREFAERPVFIAEAMYDADE